jgi:hypothetical protein
MPVNGLRCNYRFGNSIVKRGEFPDPRYIFQRFPRDPLDLAIYILYNAVSNTKSSIKKYQKKLCHLFSWERSWGRRSWGRISDYNFTGDFGSATGIICHGKHELMPPVACTTLSQGVSSAG